MEAINEATFRRVEDLARYLGLSKPTTLGALASGVIPGQRVGRRWVVSRQAVEAWLSTKSQAGINRPVR